MIIRKSISIFGYILLSACALTIGYFIVYPWIDRGVCVYRVSNRISVDPDFSDIREYVRSSLTPGLNRSEVQSLLETLGPVYINTGDIEINDLATDQILLKMCSHPFNFMEIYANYDKNGKLVSIYIEPDD